jgi:hypothetical protein
MDVKVWIDVKKRLAREEVVACIALAAIKQEGAPDLKSDLLVELERIRSVRAAFRPLRRR